MARGGQLILNNCLVTGTCHAKILVTRLGESRTCRMYFFTKIKNALVGYMTFWLGPELTKPGEVGDFFALVSMKSPNFCQKAKF